ncbi:MAG: purine-nucleoside phosphorylase [Elusimicrobiaceae bacterium]|nr:purine-nucleoside phosphorylase [Elusimicrobiaceae bacterium]
MITKKKSQHIARIEKAAAWLKKNLKGLTPDTLMIMGSGLSKSVPQLKNSITISYDRIPGFLRSTVEGHAGELEIGKSGALTVAIMKGRFHYYEGHAMSDLAIPIRVFGALGVKNLVVTAAVGSVHKNVKPGSFVILRDHINFMGVHPLRGVYDKRFGPMFPDLTDVYAPALRRAALAACRKNKIPAREGVYLAGFGPTYETPTEIRMFRSWGADVVGMSTVPEVLAASQLGMRVLGVACVTNLAAGISASPLTHQEVLDAGVMIASKFKGFIADLLKASAFEVKQP